MSVTTARSILAINLGKCKSVACVERRCIPLDEDGSAVTMHRLKAELRAAPSLQNDWHRLRAFGLLLRDLSISLIGFARRRPARASRVPKCPQMSPNVPSRKKLLRRRHSY
jgi:hypothetical protein